MNAKAFVVVARNSLLAELEYRFNYFMWFLSSAISVAMESAVLLLALKGRGELGGFLEEDLWRFVLVGITIRTCTGQWKVVGEGIDEVREGGFRKYLLQPIYYPAYFIARAIGDKFTITLILLFGLGCYKYFYVGSGAFLSGTAIPMFLVSFFAVNILTWQVYLMMIYGSFWIDETHFIQIAFNIGMAVFSGSLLPFTWLPEFTRNIVAFTPFQLLGDWPIRSALGRISIEEFNILGLRALLWILTFSLIVWLMGRAGIRRYEAFGG
jgi:ABC-2 type transport system permease protein